MRSIVARDYEGLSQVTAQLMLGHMHTEKGRINTAIITESTYIQGYRLLAKQVRGRPWFDPVYHYISDEFWSQDERHEREIFVCQISPDEKYFHATEVAPDHVHDLNMGSYKTFDRDIQKQGGLDLVIMEIGGNGYFCGNRLGTFDSQNIGTRLIRADETPYLREHSHKLLYHDFHSEDTSQILEYYITTGSKTAVSAKSIIFLLSEKEEAETAKEVSIDPATMESPTSIFQLHPHVAAILDEAAATLPPL